jgi:broad specificity phosphatase PhoE
LAVARRQMTFAMSLPDKQENRQVRYVLATHSPVLRAILLCYMGEDPGEPGYLEPIDLILSENGSSELRFRGLRTLLSGTEVVKGKPR